MPGTILQLVSAANEHFEIGSTFSKVKYTSSFLWIEDGLVKKFGRSR